ncbi:putative glycosyl hydrolase [Neolecta irregularis DAH-3]|uniref:Putative glycosyl hydrolase n=1 Tax=Neolecta irregularis (strain DAH-3) TaxID=1198029 RepID=A0A1U7LSB2_NEOID|nr:putative glycosyl hydrolase [Neolecta irregularis DAH-3]|eukprot:OLL25534.1 putative glycosyl hydrolase [Neolecta irregularis DAH-3]
MTPFLEISGPHFHHDEHVLTLRGLNLAADTKFPYSPNVPTQESHHFFEGDKLSFVGRPFSLESADGHLARIKSWGFNVLRYLVTWEAVEHAGPDKYDDEYIDFTIAVLRKCKEHGFWVFMDPHQDVWSRFFGGSGAPLWTVYLAGFNPRNFLDTEAALVHNILPEPENFPAMIWSTNYHRLACFTLFTMFFGGREFTPNCIVDGVNIQDYLQDHFFNAMQYMARKIVEAGDLEDSCVIGWETLNEAHEGLIGHADVTIIPSTQHLRKGTCPTAFQAMITGMGFPATVDVFKFTSFGTRKIGTKLIDPAGTIAWVDPSYDDSRYGWKRDPGWKLGECIWAQQGIWDPITLACLIPDYFSQMKDGTKIDNASFLEIFFNPYFKKFLGSIRQVHKQAIIFIQPPVLAVPPVLKDENLSRIVYSPHFYDGLTLMNKSWNPYFNIDTIGFLRGRYLSPLLAIRVGEKAIRNCFCDQLVAIKKEGLENIGNTPCLLSEIGIPFDMDGKAAYDNGNYSSQIKAMDANNFALEGAMLNYTFWTYCATNSHKWGDGFNGEDVSVWSSDNMKESSDTASINSMSQLSLSPMNEIASGARAFVAFARPSPILTAGEPLGYSFDLRNITFTFDFQPFEKVGLSTLYIPDFHFKRNIEIEVSSGRTECKDQILSWWHEGLGIQKLRIKGSSETAFDEKSIIDEVCDFQCVVS